MYLRKTEAVRALMRETEATTARRGCFNRRRYSLTIAGTDHGNFSDLVLFLKQPEGRTDPRRVHEIINAYTLAFFDQYIRGKPSDLLAAGGSPFTEAKLVALRR
jgi:hypothetical protein